MILDSSGDSSEVQFHTFFDANHKAYGAAAFLRVKHEDRISVDLITSKSREVKKILDQKYPTKALFWTDSQVTLYGIKCPSHRSKHFGANKVRETQSLTDPNLWFLCSGKENPADLLTRGISVDTYNHLQVAEWILVSASNRIFDKRTRRSDPRKGVFNGNEKELKSKRRHLFDID
ncbi:uncharacterized protein TNCV_3065281 [Trichonephila clavipes]|nr:uncharacterized protein TNCV_3065281 [Trichonephila clavipes]